MKRPLIVGPEAEKELAEAYEWYKEQVQGLGSDFLLHVEAAPSSLQRSFQSYPVVYKNIHRSLARLRSTISLEDVDQRPSVDKFPQIDKFTPKEPPFLKKPRGN
jgi:hypothetical protein